MAADLELERAALAIFLQAVDQPSAEQRLYIEAQCDSDPQLRARVLQLLTRDELTREPLSQIELPAMPTVTPSTQLGPYQLEALIGQGGMGRVYRARRTDGAFQRTVAIKFIHATALSPALLERFKSERQIMAQLQHPNITALLDGGTDQDHPYLVMESVEGQPFIHDPTQSIPTQLRRAIKVCQALNHAHSRLVLHRDVKPDNVLIDVEGEPKLLDFGIAKLQQSIADANQPLTAFGQAPGTPSYTAPECLNGEPATVQSDVYSVGVLLFEVLSGKRPYDLQGLTLEQTYRRVSSGPEPKLQSAAADLDRIIATAMHRDPARRYPSTLALAQDIQRYLEKRPILARSDDALYVFARLVQRHRLAVTVAAVALLTVLGSLIVTLKALQESEQQRAIAQEQVHTSTAAMQFLGGILQAADPMALQPVNDVDEVLKAATERLREDAGLTPSARSFLVATLASIYGARGEQARGEQLADQATNMLQQDPNQSLVAETWLVLANANYSLRRFADAVTATNASFTHFDQQSPKPWAEIAQVHAVRGNAEFGRGEHDAATAAFQKVLDLYAAHSIADSRALAQAHSGLDNLFSNLNRLDEALVHNSAVIDIMTREGTIDTVPGLQIQANRGFVLEELNRFEEADRQYDLTIAAMRRKLGTSHPWVIEAVTTRGRALHRRGHAEQTIELMEPLLPIVRNELAANDSVAIYFNAKLGYALCKTDRLADGLVLLQTAFESASAIYPADNWNIADTEGAVGFCQMQLGNYSAAKISLSNSVQLFTKVFGPDHYATKNSQKWLTELLQKLPEG